MQSRNDPMGQAIADFHRTGHAGRLQVLSPMFDDDVMPLDILFRGYDEMPSLERKALDIANGRVLDVGAGAGCHSLVLQERGLNVTAIDISPLSVQTMKARGLKNAMEQDFFTMTGQYDTVLMLMNGIGIVGRLARLPEFFARLDRILAPSGQVLCDSSDLRFLFEDDNGILIVPEDTNYYGECSFTMKYKGVKGDPFEWLYVDADTLKKAAAKCGYNVETIAVGDHYEYLARITKDTVTQNIAK